MTNISKLPEFDRDERQAALENLKRALPMIMEFAKLDAQIRKAKFDAFLSAGFSEAQALELTKGSLM
jgi:hypothetical protein